MKTKKKKHGGLIVIGIIILILLLLVGAVFFAANHYLNKINKVSDEPLETVAPDLEDFETDEGVEFEEIMPEDIDWEELEPLMDDDLINLLLVGQDRRPGQGRQRSDSMIVCSINPDTMEISLVSFLRDLYVDFPGDYSDNRLNAAYAFGGFPLLTETLYLNFGVTIDGCFEVDFGGFTEIIDTVGGVDITLTEAEARIMDDGSVAGLNHLTGAQALKYSRIRYIDSDFNRTGRQRNVITAVFNKIKGQSVKQLMALLNVVLPCITTDMSNTQIMSLAMNIAPHMADIQLASHYVPPRDSYQSARIRGMAVLVPDRAKIREYLKYEYLPLHAVREE